MIIFHDFPVKASKTAHSPKEIPSGAGLAQLFAQLVGRRETSMKTGEISIPAENGKVVKGDLSIPDEAEAIVIFSHGSGSSRFSPRNRLLAGMLNTGNMAALLVDLLTPEEDADFDNRFNIDLLTGRLMGVTKYVLGLDGIIGLSVGYFGASTGAASALQAASLMEKKIKAVVSRGGRPDLAGNITAVKTPTLLIIGSLDTEVIKLNRQAFAMLGGEKELVIVEGASHFFEETGKLEEVGRLAAGWFKKHLREH
jgi:putative phosphoribosyl transferase